MREGSSHELCALTLTKALIHSSRNLKLPVVHTYLDTKAAFDSSLKEHMVHDVFNAADKIPSQSILYIANRLTSRKTYQKHNTTVMGPISDTRGVEQGGISSSRLFQLTTDNAVKTLNNSGLGVTVGPTSLMALTLADDQVLLANNLDNTQSLIKSAVYLSSQNNYEYVPSKTKILVTNPKPSKSSSQPIHPDSTWTVGGVSVPISYQARSFFGNFNLVLTKGHRTPPATSL